MNLSLPTSLLLLLAFVAGSQASAFIPFITTSASRRTALSSQTSICTEEVASWAGSLQEEANTAAQLVCSAVQLCQKVQQDLAVAREEVDSLGTTVSADAAKGSSSTDVKVDGTPVTAADFGIQAYVSAKLASLFPEDRFMGEEDGSDLRADAELLKTSKDIALDLITKADDESFESDDDFLAAIDRGIEPSRKKNERVWILDPIDGTKGLITGQQYIVGLALVDGSGKTLVSAMGNPSIPSPQVMVAVRDHGLRYWSVDGSVQGEEMARIKSDWQQQTYDYTKLEEALSPEAGVDYPPFLLSRPMSVGSPLPFGPQCAPSTICCGAQVKYFAVARGEVAGFIQFQSNLKSWDHAPGALCVQESGGMAVDANEEEVLFGDREVGVNKGVICCAAEADEDLRERFLSCVQDTDINV